MLMNTYTITVWHHGVIILDKLELDEGPLKMLLEDINIADPAGIEYHYQVETGQ